METKTPFNRLKDAFRKWVSEIEPKNQKGEYTYGVLMSYEFYTSLCEEIDSMVRYSAKEGKPISTKEEGLSTLLTEWGMITVRYDPHLSEDFFFYLDDGY